jgi:hypothetical protein
MEKKVLFDQEYIDQHGNEIVEVQLGSDYEQNPPRRRVQWRLKNEEAYYWSENFVDQYDLFEFYHLMKYEWDRKMIAGKSKNRKAMDKMVERINMRVYELEEKNKALQKENEQLQLMIEYQPGGKRYEEAKKHFESLID